MSAARNIVVIGDAAQTIATLPEESVDMVLTSPPYFRLRDYGVPQQLGLEDRVEQWVDELDLVMQGLRRVLRPTGTLWLNLGDSYAANPSQGASAKSLLLGPERLAARLVADGWILRNKIVWAKANPMPTSVRDRFAATHECVYLFARSRRYFFDLDSVRVAHTTAPRSGGRSSTAAARAPEAWRGPNSANTQGLARLQERGFAGHRLGKNPGDVWRIASSRYRGAHHATFPLELARRAITAGCPQGGLVLDPFMGAGTTAVAAETLGRQWLGIELNPDFAALAEERIYQARAGPIAA